MGKNTYVIFGLGKAGQEFINVFPLRVAYIVDNNPAKWGSIYNGIEVCSPEKLLEEDKEKLHIFIASMYFEQIKNQLNNMGFVDGKNYSNACLYYGILRKISAFLDSPNGVIEADPLIKLLNFFSTECHKIFEVNNNFMKGNEKKLLFITNKDNHKSEIASFIKMYLIDFFKIKVIHCTEDIMNHDNIATLEKKYKKLGYSKVLYFGQNTEKANIIEEYFDNYSIINHEISISNKTQYIDIMYEIMNALGFDFKKVSVIVPNYNYEDFLDRRLSSIVEQQYPIYEIIFLDDASKDNSVMLGECLLEKNLGITQFIVNDINSGSVFKQWAKGIELSHGDYIWIAEADDYASPCMLNDLMMPFSEDGDITLSYCDSMVVDEKENWQANYSHINAQYNQECLSTGIYGGRYFIKNYLKKCNSIPNASAVLINKSKVEPEYLERIYSLKNFGDWYFYILLLTGGRVAYNSTPMNFFRRHSQSVTINSNSQQIAVEMNEIMQLVDNV